MQVVAGRAATDGLTWWVQSDSSALPALSLRLGTTASGVDSGIVPVARVLDVGAGWPACFAVATVGLRADTPYTLRAELPGGSSAEAVSRTLPDREVVGAPFTLAFGSCYYAENDTKGLAERFPPQGNDVNGADPIRLRLLLGDQLYMDLGSGTMPLFNTPDPWERYHTHWNKQQFSSFLAKGGAPTMVCADDHEFWNDYPHGGVQLRWAENEPGGPLGKEMDRAFSCYQAALNLEPGFLAGQGGADPVELKRALKEEARTLEVALPSADLFMLDTRTKRTRFNIDRPGFCPGGWLAAVERWLAGLTRPGILTLGQPIVEEAAGWWKRTLHTMGDVNLPDYAGQYARLCEAIMGAPHHVLILTGDIHWSRLYHIGRDASSEHVHEAVSSALARIHQGEPDTGDSAGDLKWEGGAASWRRGGDGGPYVSTETSTFATVTLKPNPAGGVETTVTAWGGGRQLSSDTFTMT